MAREKANYRDTLSVLIEQGYPLTLNKKGACEILKCSKQTLEEIIAVKNFEVIANKIKLGDIADYISG